MSNLRMAPMKTTHIGRRIYSSSG